MFHDLSNVSNSTISRWSKHKLGMSYKKLSIVNPKLNNPGKALEIGRWKCWIQYFQENKFEIVYVYEFSYSERNHKQMGWALKGKKRLYSESKDNFTMNFVVALSERHYYPVLGLKRSCILQIFSNYIKYLLNYTKKIQEDVHKLVIVFDNAAIHKSQHSKEE